MIFDYLFNKETRPILFVSIFNVDDDLMHLGVIFLMYEKKRSVYLKN